MHGMATWAGLFTTVLGVCFGASGPETPHLPGALPGYRVKLDPFVVPPARTVGLLVTARINGGPMLRLLLDSGTQYVVLNRKAALKSGCAGGSDLDLVGAGALSATRARQ